MQTSPTDVLNLKVTAGGRLAVNDVELDTPEALTAQLKAAAGWSPQPALHLFPTSGRGEWGTEYYFIGKVIYTALRMGFVDPQFVLHKEDGTISALKSQEPGQLDG